MAAARRLQGLSSHFASAHTSLAQLLRVFEYSSQGPPDAHKVHRLAWGAHRLYPNPDKARQECVGVCALRAIATVNSQSDAMGRHGTWDRATLHLSP